MLSQAPRVCPSPFSRLPTRQRVRAARPGKQHHKLGGGPIEPLSSGWPLVLAAEYSPLSHLCVYGGTGSSGSVPHALSTWRCRRAFPVRVVVGQRLPMRTPRLPLLTSAIRLLSSTLDPPLPSSVPMPSDVASTVVTVIMSMTTTGGIETVSVTAAEVGMASTTTK